MNTPGPFTNAQAVTTVNRYDYIIAGAGAAGLTLLVSMIESGKFAGKTILLVDKTHKNKNDRTWCFWETGKGLFEEIVHKRWNTIWFHEKRLSKRQVIAPYSYKMIRGIDFYGFCLEKIALQRNITVRYGTVTEMHTEAGGAWLLLGDEKISARYIFNSILLSAPVPAKGEFTILQHFKGWMIKTPVPVFDDTEATLMDFRTGQQHGTAFVYVMPVSRTQALIEYTLFTESLLQPQEYNEALKQYVTEHVPCKEYTVVEEEFGIIPMTSYPFPRRNGNIINIGTAGGQTKPSSGYTFRFIQKDSAAIVHALATDPSNLSLLPPAGRFGFYDSVLLNVLATGKLPGNEVFTRLFQHNPPGRIFRFLDNESTLGQELRLISTLPAFPFLKAGIEVMFNNLLTRSR